MIDSRFYSNGGDNDFRANDEGHEGTPSYRPPKYGARGRSMTKRTTSEESSELKTFEAWKKDRRWIKKGAEASHINAQGKPLFHKSQLR